MAAMALKDLEPVLWGTLSDELLHLVFLRFPVAEINQIRLLSKTWKRSIDSVDSYLSRVLEETVYPNLFGLVAKDSDDWCARLFDVKRDQWYIRSVDPGYDSILAVGAADGGLACFVSESTVEALSIVVMNPLTGKKVELPHLLSIHNVQPTIQPSLVQLTMDRQTNQYKVLVVGYIQRGYRGLFAQLYDSQTKKWSVVGSAEKSASNTFGYEYAWMEDDEYYHEEHLGPCLYDFAEGQLHRFNGNEIAQGRAVRSYALLRDRLFVLHQKRRAGPSDLIESGQRRQYYISEYRLPKNGTAWVKVETHGCEPSEDYPKEDHHLLLHACNGFLMVIGQAGDYIYGNPDVDHDKYEYVWLYNLSTFKWQVLPKVPGLHNDVGPLGLMCELRWSARP